LKCLWRVLAGFFYKDCTIHVRHACGSSGLPGLEVRPPACGAIGMPFGEAPSMLGNEWPALLHLANEVTQ